MLTNACGRVYTRAQVLASTYKSPPERTRSMYPPLTSSTPQFLLVNQPPCISSAVPLRIPCRLHLHNRNRPLDTLHATLADPSTVRNTHQDASNDRAGRPHAWRCCGGGAQNRLRNPRIPPPQGPVKAPFLASYSGDVAIDLKQKTLSAHGINAQKISTATIIRVYSY